MFAALFGLSGRRQQRRDLIEAEAESLVAAFGGRANEEVRRCGREANSMSAANYWGKVEAEIDRRFSEASLNVVAFPLRAAEAVRFDDLDQDQDNPAARSFELARTIAALPVGASAQACFAARTPAAEKTCADDGQRGETVSISFWGRYAELAGAR